MTSKKYKVGKQIMVVNKYKAGSLMAEEIICSQLGAKEPIIAP
jgi:hypothetical protein